MVFNLTTGISPLEQCIAEALYGPALSEPAAVLIVMEGAKDAADAKSGIKASLFLGLLALAGKGATDKQIRAAGARVRVILTSAIRQTLNTSGASPNETSPVAPDYSTASVYAGIVAKMVHAQRENPRLWSEVTNITEARKGHGRIRIHAESGFFESVVVCREVLKTYSDLVQGEMKKKYPSLYADVKLG